MPAHTYTNTNIHTATVCKRTQQLRKYPDKYIYEPWTAPLSVQKAANCVIGTDYPAPIVDHKQVNVSTISTFYQNSEEF
jgi:cryptochrome